jgi:hypothetical protein
VSETFEYAVAAAAYPDLKVALGTEAHRSRDVR